MNSLVHPLSVLLCLMMISAEPAHSQTISFYVSKAGNDAWSGTLPSPNRARTDGPFATLARARDAVRALRADSPQRHDTIDVFIRSGTYELTETFLLGKPDGGSATSPVVWEAYRNEHVTISGSNAIKEFHHVEDSAVLRRIMPRNRSHIVEIDLRSLGITDYGTIMPRGGPGMELFVRGKRMTLARYPNTGWLRIVDVPQWGDTLYNKGLEREKRFSGVPVGRHYGKIQYPGNRPDGWSQDQEIYLHGYWTWDWSDSFQRVQSIDTAARIITIAPPHHHYGYTTNQRFAFLNVLEELDRPGEWCLDRSRGIAYLWPPGPIHPGDIAVSMLDAPLISLDSASYITVMGFEFAHARGNGVVVNGGDHCLIGGCSFTCLGGDAVLLNGGTGNGITGCDIAHVAMGGIRLDGGDRQTLAPGNDFATNNVIHNYSEWLRTGQYAIMIAGVGNRIAHNVIHDAPFEAIYLQGNDHVVEYNEVYRVCQETGDAGALHTGRDWTWRGNVIRFNYWHDLKGPGLHGVMGVYLDDWASGFTVYGNVFYRAGRASFIGGGRDNTFENNIYIQCEPSVHVDARGLGWASYYFNGSDSTLLQRMAAMHYDRPPYSTRYPEHLTLYQDDPAVPKHNRIIRNVSYGGRWLDVYDYYAFDFDSVVTMEDNVIADPILLRRRAAGQTGWDPYYLNIDMKEGYVSYGNSDPGIRKEFAGNVIIDRNPGFVDVAHGDFRLKADSPAFKAGFKRIPMEKIGLYRDKYRRFPSGSARER